MSRETISPKSAACWPANAGMLPYPGSPGATDRKRERWAEPRWLALDEVAGCHVSLMGGEGKPSSSSSSDGSVRFCSSAN